MRRKGEKGITLVSLTVVIIILVILTNVILYNSNDSIEIKKIEKLYTDLENLRDKVSDFYNQYGKIPATVEYTNLGDLKEVLSKKNDIGKFYVIDLKAMENITLNYGKEYEQIKQIQETADNSGTQINQAEVNGYTDLYVINENSHNIFYIRGVEITQKDKQTNKQVKKAYYTDQVPDETEVDLRQIDGIKIPDGFYYIGKENNEGVERIVISSIKGEEINTTSQTQYIWQKQISIMDRIPDSLQLTEEQSKEKFIESVNQYQGYFKSKNKSSSLDVVYVPIEENKWSQKYTKNARYTDINGEEAYVPKGFYVSLAKGTSEIKNGLVITDEIDENGNSIGNEFVWIPVTKGEYTRNTSYQNKDISETAYTDLEYLPTGLLPQDETSQENETIERDQVEKYGGFYIGRYEAGQTNLTTVNQKGQALTTEMTPVSKKDTVVYNWISQENAKIIAKSMYQKENVKSALCSGIQWDMVMKFVNGKYDGKLQKFLVETADENNRHTGNKQKTGSNSADNVSNIYDLESNFKEWVAEKQSFNQENPYLTRGGDTQTDITDTITQSASYRSIESDGRANEWSTFRVVLYLL